MSTLIEMHCHSFYSPDGNRSPEEIVDAAIQNKIQVLAVTDHNTFSSQPRSEEHAKKHGLRYVRGMEVDAMTPGGQHCHFLCFQFDPSHAEFAKLAQHLFPLYEEEFKQMLPYFAEYGIRFDVDWLHDRVRNRYPDHPHPTTGHVRAREILTAEGMIPEEAVYNKVIRQINDLLKSENKAAENNIQPIDFLSLCSAVHAAGGKILLAHVARYTPDFEQQLHLLNELLKNGLDGFELYHPNNTRHPHFNDLKEYAKSTDCFLSAGSDCHDIQNPNKNRYFATTHVEDWVKDRLV